MSEAAPQNLLAGVLGQLALLHSGSPTNSGSASVFQTLTATSLL